MRKKELYSTTLLQKLALIPFLVLCICGFSSCLPSENPDLLVVGDQTPAYLRYLNLSKQTITRFLVLPDSIPNDSADFAKLSTPTKSLYRDSISVKEQESKYQQTVRLQRGGVTTVIVVPSANGLRPVDTLLSIGASYPEIFTSTPNTAGIRVVHCVPEPNTFFTVTEGCPGKPAFATNLKFKGVSTTAFVLADDNVTFTVQGKNKDKLSNQTYQFSAKPKHSYTVVLYRKNNNDTKLAPDILVLDDQNLGTSAIIYPTEKQDKDKLAYVFIGNLLKDEVTIQYGGQTFTGKPITGTKIIDSVSIHTCNSGSADTLVIKNKNRTDSIKVGTSFEINKRYMLFVTSTTNSNGILPIIAPVAQALPTTTAQVRVINADPAGKPTTVLLGAHSGNSTIIPGRTLVSELRHGAVSNSISVEAGQFPCIIQTTTQPQQLLTGFGTLKAGKNYVLLVRPSATTAQERWWFVEESTTAPIIQTLGQGAFVQIIHAAKTNLNNPSVPLQDVSQALNGALEYGKIFTTVLQPNIMLKDAPLKDGDHKSVFVIGDATKPPIKPDILVTDAYRAEANTVKRRFLNAVDEKSIFVAVDPPDTTKLTGAELRYKEFHEMGQAQAQQRTTLVFFRQSGDTTEILLRVPDITFIPGKAYTIIFSRRSDNDGYTMMILQEY